MAPPKMIERSINYILSLCSDKSDRRVGMFAIWLVPVILQPTMRNALFLACYCAFVTAANIFLKLSADAHGLVLFFLYQAGGNLAGLAGVLTYTGLLRRMPLHVAFPLSRGAGVLGVQLAASILIFRESFRPTEAIAAVVVAAGITFVGMSASRQPLSQSRQDRKK